MSREEGQIDLDKCHTDRRWKAVRFGYKAEYPPSEVPDVPEEPEFTDAPEDTTDNVTGAVEGAGQEEEPEFADIPDDPAPRAEDTAVEPPVKARELPSQDDLLMGMDEDGTVIETPVEIEDGPEEDPEEPVERPQEVVQGDNAPWDGEEQVEPSDEDAEPPAPVENEMDDDAVMQAQRTQDGMAQGQDVLEDMQSGTEPIQGGSYDTLPSQDTLLADIPTEKAGKRRKSRDKAEKTAEQSAEPPSDEKAQDTGTEEPAEERPEWQDKPTQERRHKWMDWKKWPIISTILEFREKMYDEYTWQDPFNTLGQIARWRMTRNGYITLSRVWYDSTLRIYRWDDTLVKKKDVVKRNTPYLSLIDKERQVHVTQVPKTYFLFDSHLRRPRDEHENGFTAQAQYIYAMDNSFNEALAQTSRPKNKKSDWTPLIIAGVIGLSVIVYLLFFRH